MYSLVSTPKAFRKKNELTTGYDITHCPKCGAKLPTDLADEWFAIVEKKFGVTSVLDEKIKHLPKKYKTNEWWKK
jgi:PAB1-binding protein PBP1